jgi:NAD(P)-dependent dehydrogenase (short-subunit alcohol dehydrogenase family)
VSAPIAVITGGASGIGKATGRVLSRDYGFAIVIADRNLAAAEEIAKECGGTALELDVTDEASVVAAFERVRSNVSGELRALVTCAGATDATPFMDLTPKLLHDNYAINLVGTFLCIREAARQMPAGSRVCTISSVTGRRGGGLLGGTAYAASKGAVLALSRSAARSLAERGIAVNCVLPGVTMTPMYLLGDPELRRGAELQNMLKRAADPEELAQGIAFLVSPKASFVDGESFVIDGGFLFD